LNILAIGAHPDDIEFGCGATLLQFSRRGHKVFLFVATEGEIGAKEGIRRKEEMSAVRFLGAKKVFWGGFVDTNVPTSKELIDEIEVVVKEVKPDIVFFNFSDDTHQDHRAVANCALSATRYVKKALFYEVPTTRNFEPDVFMDASSVMQKKVSLLKLHKSQIKRTRVPKLTILESALACAMFRGYQARVKFAEGFKAVRFMLDFESDKL
jgi:LmbE family N-acetylglucosaminyl deacetylase